MRGREQLRRRHLSLSRVRKLERLASIHAAKARIAAAETELLATLNDPDPIGKDFAEEVACVLRVPSSTAGSLLHHSSRLVESFPQAMDAMHAGKLPVRFAHKLAEQTLGLPDDVLPMIETTVLARASRQTPGQFGKSLTRAIAEVDTRTVERRHQLARTGRTIEWPGRQRRDDLSATPAFTVVVTDTCAPRRRCCHHQPALVTVPTSAAPTPSAPSPVD